MATKNQASTMVSGLGMGMKFLQSLTNEIVAQGDYPEKLQMLASDSDVAKLVIREMVQIIKKSEWRVPRSLLERLAGIACLDMHGNNNQYLEHDKRFYWNNVDLTEQFGIPTFRFGNEGDNIPIPTEVHDQIVGKRIDYPMIVQWEGKPYIVVEVSDDGWVPGNVRDSSFGELLCIVLAPAECFDFEH